MCLSHMLSKDSLAFYKRLVVKTFSLKMNVAILKIFSLKTYLKMIERFFDKIEMNHRKTLK